jgi:hypothetical protein
MWWYVLNVPQSRPYSNSFLGKFVRLWNGSLRCVLFRTILSSPARGKLLMSISRHFLPLINDTSQISRLYRPLSADYISDSEDEDSAQLLPSHYIPTTANPHRSKPNGATKPTHNNFSDVWDEREELFGIGGDSDDEGTGGASGEREIPVTPKITVTNADSGS